MKKFNLEIGMTYEDPEGVWEITGIDGDDVEIKNITEGDPNIGFEAIVPRDEAEYFLTHDWWV